MRRVSVQFQDDTQARLFADEMKKRFNYPKETSRYRVVHGKDENGNAVFVDSAKDNNMNVENFYPENYNPDDSNFELGFDEETGKMGFCFEFLMSGNFFVDEGVASYEKTNETYEPATYWDPESYDYDWRFFDVDEETVYNVTQERKATPEELSQFNSNKVLSRKFNDLLDKQICNYSLTEYFQDFGNEE